MLNVNEATTLTLNKDFVINQYQNGHPDEEKLIGRKRYSPREKSNNLNLHDADPDSSNLSHQPTKKNIHQNKRKSKKTGLEYYVPVRSIFKANEALICIINKVINRYDVLQLLRGYRKKIKDDPDFNNFKCRKVEKLLLSVSSENSPAKLNIDFSNENFLIEINKTFPKFKDPKETSPEIKKYSEHNDKSLNSYNNNNSENHIMKTSIELNHGEFINPMMNTIHQCELTQESLKNTVEPSIVNIRHSELKIISEEYYQLIEESYHDKIIASVDNIDILRYKVENNYYTNIKDFSYDMFQMFKYTYSNLNDLITPNSSSEIALEYLKMIFLEMSTMVISIEKTFEELLSKDFKSIIDNNKLPKTTSNFRNIPMKKEYQVIDDYFHLFPELTRPKTKTSLTSACQGGCCDNVELLGPLNLEKGRWESKCIDRNNNIECNPETCGCTPESCMNMCISKKIIKRFGEEVVEKYAWGIDLFTYRNLIEFLPMNFTDEYKANNFIEKTLIKSLSHLGLNGYSIIKTCQYIIEKIRSESSESASENTDLLFAQHLLNVYKQDRYVAESSSTAFSKGIGIFCKKKEGIAKNELISVYLGEIYPPWYWYEKQDLIKKNKLDSELPDFYNIMLERNKTDSKGYDIVMVDPNSKGNFASRMSHSCNPNCNTVLMCSNNEYVIGMFATKGIEFGDELTFDYNSVTEKEKEFQDAICLCSTFNCRGHYLIYSNPLSLSEVLSKYHSFLHRNVILLQACNPEFEMNKNEILTPYDEKLLKKYAIGSSILGKAPFWIKKWAALILRYVYWESNEMKKKQMDKLKDIKSSNSQIHKLFDEKRDELKNYKKIENNLSEPPLLKDKYKNKSENGGIKKFNFNENFYYPGKKSYRSSTRSLKLEDSNEEIKLDSEEIKKKSKIKTNSVKTLNVDNIIHDKINKIVKEKLQSKYEENGKNCELVPQSQSTNYINKDDNINQNKIPVSIEFNNINNHHNNGHSNKKDILIQSNGNITYDMDIITDENVKSETNSTTENRIQNIAITIDKVLHVLDLMKISEPPIEVLSEKEIISFYWGKENSLRSSVHKNLKKSLNITNVRNMCEFNEVCDIFKKIIQITVEDDHNLDTIREKLIIISKKIKICANLDKSNKFAFYIGLSDILFLHANTKIYFKNSKNLDKKNAISTNISIRKRDINTNSKDDDLDSTVCSGEKAYDKLYVWGQLSGWFKQTVDKPNASLSAERRGSLSYPDLDCFFTNSLFDRNGNLSKNLPVCNYPGTSRKSFYSKLIENPSMMWPVGNNWSYKNTNKIYGTVQFDSFYINNDFNLESSTSYFVNILQKMEDK